MRSTRALVYIARVTVAMAGASSRWTSPRAPGGWTVLDASLAAGSLALLVSEVVPNPDMTPRGPLIALSVAMSAPMAWRTSRPAAVAVVVAAAHLLMSAVSTGPFAPQLAILPLLVVLYSAAAGTRGRRALVTGIVTLALVVSAWLVTEEGEGDDFWPWMLWAGAWASGTFVRRRADLAAHHAERAALLELEARTVASESAAAERDRIARELHDVVAHSVSVMVVQAGAERLRLGEEAGRTGDALAAIEESGRRALAELRTMLGVLRDAGGEDPAPLPTLAALPVLVERMREAGLPVELDWHVDPTLVPDGGATGLAAYRIAQEALTNVVRHAGPVPTRVVASSERGELVLSISNVASGPHRSSAPASSGRGLIGMRERAAAVGGTVAVGPIDDGCFAVCARLPWDSRTRT